MPVALHFLFDLGILTFSILWPLARNFRFDFAIFAPIAHNFYLDLEIFLAGAHHFLRDLTNFEPVACYCQLDSAIFCASS